MEQLSLLNSWIDARIALPRKKQLILKYIVLERDEGRGAYVDGRWIDGPFIDRYESETGSSYRFRPLAYWQPIEEIK